VVAAVNSIVGGVGVAGVVTEAGYQAAHWRPSTALPVGIAAALVLFELHLLYQQQRATDRVLQPPAGSGSS
jgi:hypothetical protein